VWLVLLPWEIQLELSLEAQLELPLEVWFELPLEVPLELPLELPFDLLLEELPLQLPLAEILGNHYSKKSQLPSINDFLCLANSPKLSSY
jgi:hypothetical protein